jgi:hypothetical protein
MLTELEFGMRTAEAKEIKRKQHVYDQSSLSQRNNLNKEKKIMGGVEVNEQDFEDENLCQICCSKQINVEFVSCQH